MAMIQARKTIMVDSYVEQKDERKLKEFSFVLQATNFIKLRKLPLPTPDYVLYLMEIK